MIIDTITNYIELNNLIAPDTTIIIGLSGGPDSVFLLQILSLLKKHYNVTLIAAHLDHEWRSNSSQDVIFCAQLCQKLDIPFISKKASKLSLSYKNLGSQEALGRTLRRYFLEEVRHHYNADSIALAHHEQDQQETFFIRLIRGTTLSGLISMQPKAGYYIRPLLHISKNEILAYLHKHEIPYLTDPTNLSESYLRNRIRLNVLPALQDADQRFDKNFLRTLSSLQETEAFLQAITEKTYKELKTTENKIDYLMLSDLLNLTMFLQKRVLIHWLIEQNVPFTPTESLLSEIQRFLNQNKSNTHIMHTTWLINKKQNKIFISKIKNEIQ